MKFSAVLLIIAGLLVIPAPGFCLDPDQILVLTSAGVGEETIAVMIREKTVATRSFTVDEVIRLKRAGLGEKTLQMILTQGSFLKDRQDVVYGEHTRTLKNLRVKDIISLKEKGVSDPVIQSVITAGSTASDEKDREKAWDMLMKMGIIQERDE